MILPSDILYTIKKYIYGDTLLLMRLVNNEWKNLINIIDIRIYLMNTKIRNIIMIEHPRYKYINEYNNYILRVPYGLVYNYISHIKYTTIQNYFKNLPVITIHMAVKWTITNYNNYLI